MKREPLAKVETFDDWSRVVVDGGTGTVINDVYRVLAERVAANINAAVEKREAPLLALLAEALRFVMRVRDTHWREVHPGYLAYDIRLMPVDMDVVRALATKLEGLDFGEWVPAAKYRELERVLGDLKEERRDVWRERCEAALKALRANDAMAVRWQNAEAILAGRLEVWSICAKCRCTIEPGGCNCSPLTPQPGADTPPER